MKKIAIGSISRPTSSRNVSVLKYLLDTNPIIVATTIAEKSILVTIGEQLEDISEIQPIRYRKTCNNPKKPKDT